MSEILKELKSEPQQSCCSLSLSLSLALASHVAIAEAAESVYELKKVFLCFKEEDEENIWQ